MQEYARRLSHYCRFELVELPEAKKARDTAAAIAEEATTILGRLERGEALVALDERGKPLTSRGLADYLARLSSSARDAAFVVGGAEGLGEEVRRKADLVLSLSAMTLPHRLARLLVAEQLYRAFTLLRGEPYHR